MKYLGMDFGLKRVGLAQSEGELATPWKVIEGRGINDLLEKIKKVALEFDYIIIGMPEGKIGEIVKRVARDLRESGLDVEEADETLSSQHATALMVELNIPKKKRKINDDISAAEILQNWLDNR